MRSTLSFKLWVKSMLTISLPEMLCSYNLTFATFLFVRRFPPVTLASTNYEWHTIHCLLQEIYVH